jgi:hypothetical protein
MSFANIPVLKTVKRLFYGEDRLTIEMVSLSLS